MSETRSGAPEGFTLVETMMALAVVAIILSAASFPLRGSIMRSRLTRTAEVIAGDLQRAFSLAERQRRPVRLRCLCLQATYLIEDRDSGTLLFQRNLGADEDLKLSGMAFSPAGTIIYPNGLASSPLTITIASGEFARSLRITSAGQVWIRTP